MFWHHKEMLIAAALAVGIVLTVAACGGSPPAEEQIETLIERNLEANDNDDFEALYELFAPSNRGECPLERYIEISGIDSGIGGIEPKAEDVEVTFSDLEIEVMEKTARASLVLHFDTAEVPLTDVRFVKEGSKWYFEMPAEILEACQE